MLCFPSFHHLRLLKCSCKLCHLCAGVEETLMPGRYKKPEMDFNKNKEERKMSKEVVMKVVRTILGTDDALNPF